MLAGAAQDNAHAHFNPIQAHLVESVHFRAHTHATRSCALFAALQAHCALYNRARMGQQSLKFMLVCVDDDQTLKIRNNNCQ